MLKRFPASDHVAYLLLRFRRHTHDRELTGAIEPGELGRIALVVLRWTPGAVGMSEGAMMSRVQPQLFMARRTT